MRLLMVCVMFLLAVYVSSARNVTIRAVDQPAAEVFRTIVEQTGMNFVYSSDVLSDLRISIVASDRPLKSVLAEMFRGTGVKYKIRGNNVVISRKRPQRITGYTSHGIDVSIDTMPQALPSAKMLDEVVVVSRLEATVVETTEIGAKKVTADEVRRTPALFGESDVIKALHMQPGVTEGTEGMAGMNVHGGNADENLYMLDNVPLYQVNHFAGLFSAFNTDIIRYIDFFKSSVPAKYDGRLSSFMDVRLRNGNADRHHGSARLGLTSGAFNLSGPIGARTSYLVGLRRSWYDVLTIPILAIVNSGQDEKVKLHYYFMDLNAKVSRRFSNRLNGFVSVYFGDDMLRTGTKDDSDAGSGWSEDETLSFHWGNLVAQTGLNYRLTPSMTAEFTAAYTRYFSSMKHDDENRYTTLDDTSYSHEVARTDNNINDWIFRGDFDWHPAENSRIRCGAGYVRHSFLPARTVREYTFDTEKSVSRDSTWTYGANEINAYIEDDWRVTDRFRMNAGVHISLFGIDGKTKYGVSPRVSLSYRVRDDLALKAAYSRTVQYVHQLTQSYLALPTDQWIPVTGNFKPQTADKIAAGIYWQAADGMCEISAEVYWKWMRNLLDYRDEYYLKPPLEMWDARLTTGRGTAKGIDLKVEKTAGKFTGHVAYSLAWADRTFAGKNGGCTFPARFDNRHTVNLLVSWQISDKVQLSASWTGHSGNRFTLLPQMWEIPTFGGAYYPSGGEAPLAARINNYQLPFYHRLDLSCTVRNRRGYWTFGLYNAYNHLNTIAVRRVYRDVVEQTPTGISYVSHPVFQKVKLLPIIPSISYTWQF